MSSSRREREMDQGVPRRKYKRHPKPDLNAPQRPLTAYVRFTKAKRKEYEPLRLSFAELAKRIGGEWQQLSETQKAVYREEASMEWATYRVALTEYRQSPQHEEYLAYLKEFARQNPDSQPTASDREASPPPSEYCRTPRHDYDDAAHAIAHPRRHSLSTARPDLSVNTHTGGLYNGSMQFEPQQYIPYATPRRTTAQAEFVDNNSWSAPVTANPVQLRDDATVHATNLEAMNYDLSFALTNGIPFAGPSNGSFFPWPMQPEIPSDEGLHPWPQQSFMDDRGS